MKILFSLVTILYVSIIVTAETRNLQSRKKILCDQEVYSAATPNEEWAEDGHRFFPQIWYHSLDEVHNLWQKGHFDYVIDVRSLQDREIADGVFIPGWETAHIPGSFVVNTDCVDDDSCEAYSLDEFLSSGACLDARIYVHCWIGVLANRQAQRLIELGFRNVHASGPEGDAGFIKWEANGWDVVYGDTYKPQTPRCARQCN